MQKKLTETKIKTLKPKKNSYRIADGEGLALEVRPNGCKYWRYRYRNNKNKGTMKTIGQYPYVSLKEAREKIRNIKESLEKDDIVDENELKLENIARDWFAKTKEIWSESTFGYKDSILNKDILPFIGKNNIRNITQKNLIECLRRIENRNALDTVKKARTILRDIFNYAIAMGFIENNIVYNITHALKKHKEKNYSTFTDPKDVRILLRAIDNYHGSFIVKCALKFFVLTFNRPGPTRMLEWSEISFNDKMWYCPASKMKMKREHLIPLSSQAIEILKEVQCLTVNGKYVFPSLTSKNRPLSDNTFTTALRRMGFDKKEIVAHGIRQTASTMLNEAGWPSLVIERQLAHIDKNKVRNAYNKAEYLEIRKVMMEWWADYLWELKESGEAFYKYISKNALEKTENDIVLGLFNQP